MHMGRNLHHPGINKTGGDVPKPELGNKKTGFVAKPGLATSYYALAAATFLPSLNISS
jgi:hypothetical protein